MRFTAENSSNDIRSSIGPTLQCPDQGFPVLKIFDKWRWPGTILVGLHRICQRSENIKAIEFLDPVAVKLSAQLCNYFGQVVSPDDKESSCANVRFLDVGDCRQSASSGKLM